MESKVYIDPYPKTMKMLGLERINIDCGNNTSIVTPANIAKDMVALLPDEVFRPESKFLDICCKSGIFLTSIREKLMNSPTMIEAIPDYKERYKYITNNQLYGIAPNGQCQMYSVRAVYGTLKVDNPHILCFGVFDQYKTACLNNNHKMLIEEMKKEFGQMRFDVVIGNPPYNNDIYLDFVTLGHTLASKYDCWITPAKWQAKGGQKNEDFRKSIVPYMSKIVYYPDCLDVFAIADSCGICYYIIDKDIHDECEVTNKSSIRSDLNSVQERKILRKQSLWNVGNSIVEHIGQVNSFKVGDVQKRKKYTVSINTQSSIMRGFAIKEQDDNGKWRIRQDLVGKGGAIFDKDGKVVVLGKISILAENGENVSGTSKCIFTSDNAEEVKSFLSYIQSKLVSFLVFIGISGLTIINDETWRFVPKQEAFDHIFTDEELYKKYKLTDEEINIIESVIKERK